MALRKLVSLNPMARQQPVTLVRSMSTGGGQRCRCWPNPPCHHHSAGNCGYGQFECQSKANAAAAAATTTGAAAARAFGGVTVSHHHAGVASGAALQQAMHKGAQQAMGALSQAGQAVSAVSSRLQQGMGAMMLDGGRPTAAAAVVSEPEFFTR